MGPSLCQRSGSLLWTCCGVRAAPPKTSNARRRPRLACVFVAEGLLQCRVAPCEGRRWVTEFESLWRLPPSLGCGVNVVLTIELDRRFLSRRAHAAGLDGYAVSVTRCKSIRSGRTKACDRQPRLSCSIRGRTGVAGAAPNRLRAISVQVYECAPATTEKSLRSADAPMPQRLMQLSAATSLTSDGRMRSAGTK